MFAFDHSALPQLTHRKAFIGVDFQNDFIAKDGALPVPEPEGFVDLAAKLATAFREVGDVVWVQSQFDKPRDSDEDLIITTDIVPAKVRPSSRRKIPVETVEESGPPDPEAFLSHEEPACVKPGSPGCGITPAIEEASRKTDLKLTKTHYSAFQSTHLLRHLRAKMVMEVFICGSLTNVGVYATALDAAGHGMAITIVHDCCGFRSESRQAKAINGLIDLTGCEIASYDEVMEIIQPEPQAATESAGPSSKGLEALRKTSAEEGVGRKSLTPEIVKNMTGLRLASDSPSPAIATQPRAEALTASPAKGGESTTKPQSKAEEYVGTKSSSATVAGHNVDARNAPTIKDAIASVPNHNEGHQQPQQSPNDDKISTPEPASKSRPKPTPMSIPKSNSTPEGYPVAKEAMDSTKARSASAEPKSEPKFDAEAELYPESRPELKNDDSHFLQKGLCEGDTDIIEGVLPNSLADGVFDKLREEVQWQRMSHQGGEVPRLVAVQGQGADDGSIPVYRHPSDESPPLLPFSPTVLAIKAETEKCLGHPLNHVLIQHYRDGSDYISEHSDKTLDIVRGSFIANVSLGAERTMVFRTKRLDKDPSRTGPPPADSKRQIQRARLPHNSLCRLGLQSNKKWLHAIRQDKRAEREKSAAELAYNGGRISLTFRQIGTFLDREETIIWGQGATAKKREDAHAVINGQTPEAIEMLKAFGTENHATEFDWDAYYGKGFDVLHMSQAPRFFSSTDPIVNNRINFMLAEFGVNHAKGSISPSGSSKGEAPVVPPPRPGSSLVKFVDKDKSVVEGDLAIMLYLDARYGAGKPGVTPRSPLQLATQFTRFQQGIGLFKKWRCLSKDSSTGKRVVKPPKQDLVVWDGFAAEAEGDFLAGPGLSLPDFAVWPVLHALVEEAGVEALDSLESLKKYYEKVADRPSISKFMGQEAKAQTTEKAK
ncbi:hypothetical protein AK830_g1947 [Neonectria ditissima]|uniref:Fe2OG dioxygenase domain-containing protein n=1 Tax=Neonectria ditissima TaxID=78410 RepID=A0A0P7BVZ8_9HYPO|nr:hypothetical protein AK830_g1947 [Neonectria ditissima]